MAPGAQRRAVIGMVLRDTFAMVALGVAIGIPAALAASRASRRVLDQVLFGLEPNDPVATGCAVGTLAGVAILGSFLPARRASQVDPMIALHCE